MSDTPRTDDEEFESQDEPVTKLGAVDVDFACQLERELNTANAEIERLTNKVAQLYEGAEEQKQRIKRLEEAGDAAIHEAGHGREHDALEIWNKAKEAKL